MFEKSEKDVADVKIIEQIQRGAVEFAEDFIDMLGEYRNEISIKPQEISLPYEGFIRFASDMDLKVFSASFFEDEVWGGVTRINIAEFIKGQYNSYSQNNDFPNVQVAINHIAYDDKLVRYAKVKLRDHPHLYKMAKRIYRSL